MGSDPTARDIPKEILHDRRLLSESSAGFRFALGQTVKAPLFVGGKRKVAGTIREGIRRSGRVFYEIEVLDGPGCRFAALEEEMELLIED